MSVALALLPSRHVIDSWIWISWCRWHWDPPQAIDLPWLRLDLHRPQPTTMSPPSPSRQPPLRFFPVTGSHPFLPTIRVVPRIAVTGRASPMWASSLVFCSKAAAWGGGAVTFAWHWPRLVAHYLVGLFAVGALSLARRLSYSLPHLVVCRPWPPHRQSLDGLFLPPLPLDPTSCSAPTTFIGTAACWLAGLG